MKNSFKVTVLAGALASVLPLQGNAAGLGGINVFSALGQPLRAEIELHATPEELQSMSAAVPSPEAFRRANLDYSPLMTDLEMKVERRGNRSVIRLSSSRVINEPFMDVLVELRWAAGSLLREYTFLLDPAESVRPLAAAPAPAVRPARSAPATTRPAVASGTHVVRRGETMNRIARTYLPAGATLEQMMVALLRENPQAFVDGNINRLRAGASLNIPDRQAVSALSADQARREVLVQKEEFEAYRNRVAGSVAARPAATPKEASRESAGRVEPRVQEVVREATPSDKVEVSGGTAETATPPSADAGADSRQDATSTPEEDFVALRRELEEMRSRLSELEQVVTDQQEIIAIRDSMIAGMQGQTEGAVVDAEPAAVAAPSSAPAEPAQSVQAPQAPPPAPAPVPAAAPGLFDRLMADPLMLGGGAAIVGLLALLGLRVARRRREDGEADSFMPLGEPNDEPLSVVSQPGGESVDTDTSSSVMDSDFSQTGLSAIDADEGVDPVAEADVYLAYGRDAQAEEILLDALKVDASRHAISLKLLEVYQQRGDRRQFETIATDLYARTGGDGGDWKKAAAMGRKLDPENPLYGEGKADAGEASAATALAAAAAANAVSTGGGLLEDTHVGLDQTELQIPGYEDDVSSQEEQVSADEETADLDFDLGDFGQIGADAAVDQSPDANDDDNGLDFEKTADQFPSLSGEDQSEPVPKQDAGGAGDSGVTGDAGDERTALDLEKTEFDNSVLDFDLDLSEPSSEQVGDSGDVASLSVQGEDSASPESANGTESEGEAAAFPRFDVQDMQGEMETKLELARAYDEMGDREGARELLEEVVNDGADEQREEARRMLERLS